MDHPKQKWANQTFRGYCIANDVASIRALAKRYDLRRLVKINECFVDVPMESERDANEEDGATGDKESNAAKGVQVKEEGKIQVKMDMAPVKLYYIEKSKFTVLMHACYFDSAELMEWILSVFGDKISPENYVNAFCVALICKGSTKECVRKLMQSATMRHVLCHVSKFHTYNDRNLGRLRYYIKKSRHVDSMRMLYEVDEENAAFFPSLVECIMYKWTDGVQYLTSIGYCLDANFVGDSPWCELLGLRYVWKLIQEGAIRLCQPFESCPKVCIYKLLYNQDRQLRSDFDALKPILLHIKSMGQEFGRCTDSGGRCPCRDDRIFARFPGVPDKHLLFLMKNGIWQEGLGEKEVGISYLHRRWKMELLCMGSIPPKSSMIEDSSAPSPSPSSPSLHKSFFHHPSFERNLIPLIGEFL